MGVLVWSGIALLLKSRGPAVFEVVVRPEGALVTSGEFSTLSGEVARSPSLTLSVADLSLMATSVLRFTVPPSSLVLEGVPDSYPDSTASGDPFDPPEGVSPFLFWLSRRLAACCRRLRRLFTSFLAVGFFRPTCFPEGFSGNGCRGIPPSFLPPCLHDGLVPSLTFPPPLSGDRRRRALGPFRLRCCLFTGVLRGTPPSGPGTSLIGVLVLIL